MGSVEAMRSELVALGIPEPRIVLLGDDVMGVTGEWPWAHGETIRYSVRVPVGAVEQAAEKLKIWWEQRNGQAETEAAS